MTFLTNVGVKEILCSFTLFLEWKTGKEIPESNLEMFLPNNLALSGAKDNTTGPLNRGGSADLYLSRTLFGICQKSRKPLLGSDRLLCFTSKWKFGCFKKTFTAITILCELFFRFGRFILLVQTKKVISVSYATVQTAVNHGDE